MLLVLLIVGVRESSFLNKVFTVLNIFVILVITIIGATKADFKNWSIASDVKKTP